MQYHSSTTLVQEPFVLGKQIRATLFQHPQHTSRETHKRNGFLGSLPMLKVNVHTHTMAANTRAIQTQVQRL